MPVNASFEEKSVWVQLVALVLAMGGYCVAAAVMMGSGVTEISSYIPLFGAAVVALVVIMIAGHAVAAAGDREPADERDHALRARARDVSSWVLPSAVVLAVGGLVLAVDAVWVAHLLLGALIVSEIVEAGLRLFWYRRGF